MIELLYQILWMVEDAMYTYSQFIYACETLMIKAPFRERLNGGPTRRKAAPLK